MPFAFGLLRGNSLHPSVLMIAYDGILTSFGWWSRSLLNLKLSLIDLAASLSLIFGFLLDELGEVGEGLNFSCVGAGCKLVLGFRKS
jgi:hypothetical protein